MQTQRKKEKIFEKKHKEKKEESCLDSKKPNHPSQVQVNG